MTPERWRRIDTIFSAAVDLPQDRRAAYLDDACAGQPELRAEVEAMLAGDAEAQSAVRDAVADAHRLMPEAPVRHFGPYRVIGIAGRGGMGAVYKAVRDDRVYEKEVAIKVVRLGVDSPQSLARFRQERQILARLEHPNIARLIDGGETGDGQPYLVMEFVDGIAITRWASERDLGIGARLHLFLEVCAAIEYAHSNLVVHRDIKPGNVLVTPAGIPKLLDFGIAKLLDPAEAEVGVTSTATLAFTPDYASPEQASGERVSTASDIYSLGALLFELLTGEAPHRFPSHEPAEVVRVLRETAVRRPSTVSSSLRRKLAGDLDNIVLKAMHREPARRYRSVGALADDIRRHLEGLPVTARPDTWGYRAGKFVGRHAAGLVAASLVIVSLVAGANVAVWQARQANRRFEEVRTLANRFLFDFHDSIRDLPGSTKARELVVRTGVEYLDGLAKEAGSDRSLQLDLARSYLKVADIQAGFGKPNLGQVDAAIGSLTKAIGVAARLSPSGNDADADRVRVAALRARATTLLHNGREGARPDLELASKLMEKLLRSDQATAADFSMAGSVTLDLGDIELGAAAPDAALILYRKGVQFLQRAAEMERTADRQRAIMAGYSRLGVGLAGVGDLEGALAYQRKRLEYFETVLAQNPRDAASRRQVELSLQDVGNLLGFPDQPNLGDSTGALDTLRRYLQIVEATAAEDPNDVTAQGDLSRALSTVGRMLQDTGPRQAAELNMRAARVAEALPRNTASRFLQLVGVYRTMEPLRKLGHIAEARKALNRTGEIAKEVTAGLPDSSGLGEIRVALDSAAADQLRAEGDWVASLEMYRRAVAGAEKLVVESPTDLNSRYTLADNYAALARHWGERDSKQSCEVLKKALRNWVDWRERFGANAYCTRRERQARQDLAKCGGPAS
jgi:tetratricopeptide (TPR) repeat protein